MGASVFISGVREPDGKLGDMLDLLEQCDKLGVKYPPELVDYFKGTEVLEMKYDREAAIQTATEFDLEYGPLAKINGLVEGNVEYGDGATIDLTKLPDDIKKLRIYMS